MKSSLFKNLRLQTYLQVINTIIPLITTPYISRVLGANNIGIYSSHHAMAEFFTLFAIFGMGSYGTRCIAAESDENKRKALFMELYTMQLITCSISSICYLGYCLFLADNSTMAYLQFITLVGCFIDISWFYFGIEDFVSTVVSSTIFRVLSVLALFFLVRSSDDLFIYAFIMLSSAFMSQLVLWIKLCKNGYIKYVKVKNITRHFLPNLNLFIPSLAMTVCASTDKAMLGSLSTYEQSGYYTNVEKVINVPFCIFSGFSTAFLPRMTAIYSQSKEKAKAFFFDTLSGIIMLGVAMSFGIIAVSDVFIPLFLGDGYEPCILLIKIFSPIIIIKCISNAIRVHFLIPFHMEKIYIKSTCIGALLNVCLNFILIPRYGAIGAIIATFASETIILLVQVYHHTNYMN